MKFNTKIGNSSRSIAKLDSSILAIQLAKKHNNKLAPQIIQFSLVAKGSQSNVTMETLAVSNKSLFTSNKSIMSFLASLSQQSVSESNLQELLQLVATVLGQLVHLASLEKSLWLKIIRHSRQGNTNSLRKKQRVIPVASGTNRG